MSELLHKRAPEFSLAAVGGGRFKLSEAAGKILVINFWSAECAWSRRADVVLVYRMLTWASKGVLVVGIVSNVTEIDTDIFPEAQRRGVKYPLLLDPGNSVADLYKAYTTPQFYICDAKHTICYAGALDDGDDQHPTAKTIYVDRAVSALLAGKQPDPAATNPFGCPIVRRSRESNVQTA
jgi:peroxiredoxin